MTPPMVTVFRGTKVRGWPDSDGKTASEYDRGYVVPLATALARAFTTDAHFTQYRSPINRRMNSDALDRGVAMDADVLVLDVDCPDTHGTSNEVPHEWRRENRERVLALRAAHPGCVYYETRGGSRIVYRQPVPTTISTRDDGVTWKQDYAIIVAYISRVFGIDADYSCADWTRFFRCPRATRINGAQPEARAIAGNPNDVKPLWAEPDEDDLATARARLKSAFEPPRMPTIASGSECVAGDGMGVLFHALNARGDVLREHKRGTYLVRCPNEAQHSSGKAGDTSTILYLPSPGQELGYIKCLHGHCVGMQTRDWMRAFSDGEILAAKQTSGVK